MSASAGASFDAARAPSGLRRIARSRLVWRATPAAALVLTGWLLFPSSGQDDVHITVWPAFTLSQSGQILNYNGERVEQSSTLLQVVLIAALRTLTGVDPVTLAKLTSMAGGVAAVLLVFTLVARVGRDREAFCAAALVALSTPLLYWSFSGMESSLVAAAGTWFVLASADYLTRHPSGSLLKAVLALVTLALARPEAPLLIGCLLAGALAVAFVRADHPDPPAPGRTALTRRAITLTAMGAVVCAALFAFRWMYFGDLFPQPVSAKVSGAWGPSAESGWLYVRRHTVNAGRSTALVAGAFFLGIAVAAVRQIRARGQNVHVVLSLLFVVSYLCAIILSGGDWMPAGRFLVHCLPVAIALLPMSFVGLQWGPWALRAVTVLVLLLEVYAVVSFTRRLSTSVPIWGSVQSDAAAGARRYSWFERRNRINVRDMPLIDRLDGVVADVYSHRQSPVVIFSGQMGMVSYHVARRHFGRVRFVDRHGLIERSLTDCTLTPPLPRDKYGLVLWFEQYFENFATLERSCHQVRPDIVFDIGTYARSGVSEHGYELVYEQSGEVSAAGTRLKGAPVPLDAYIALDAARVPLLREPGASARSN